MLSLVNLKRGVNWQLPWKRQFIFRQVNYKTPVVYWLEFLVFILSRVITNYKNANWLHGRASHSAILNFLCNLKFQNEKVEENHGWQTEVSVNLSNLSCYWTLFWLPSVRILSIQAPHLLRTVKIFLIKGYGVFHVKVNIFVERVNPQVVRKTHKFQICMCRPGS